MEFPNYFISVVNNDLGIVKIELYLLSSFLVLELNLKKEYKILLDIGFSVELSPQ